MKRAKRLLAHIKPTRYDLLLDVNFNDVSYSGTLKLQALLQEESNQLTLHGLGIDVSEVVIKAESTELTASNISYNEDEQQITVTAPEKIPEGKIEIDLTFTGKCSNDMLGFYVSKYGENNESQMLSTQFESHYARRVFPCIDEPAAKAVFDLTIKTTEEVEVLANTPKKNKEINDGQQIVTFESTPKMPTYLLAWALGNFEYRETTSNSGVNIRTVTTVGKVAKTKFALDVARKVLDFYEDYFKIPYPLQKIDLIAIPEFSSGAMENWGLITFREEAFLIDEKHSSITSKQFAAKVMAHELAHQWFGNLVTMRWWNDLWLNEGFASWIEYLAVDNIFPEWNIWTDFVSADWDAALQLDSLYNTHPIEVSIHNPSEINEAFDAISYQKGAASIRMLYEFVGEKAFRDGLNDYLKRHSYANTTTDDLWEALAAASGKPVKEFMHQWTTQSGYPLVSYKKESAGLNLTQQRFIMNPQARKDHQAEAVWPVRLTNFNGENEYFLREKSEFWNLPSQNNPKLNHEQVGVYRVLYEPEDLNVLATSIEKRGLPNVERLGLLSDVFAATRAGFYDIGRFFYLLDSYQNEDNHHVWDIISYSLNVTWRVFDSEQARTKLKTIFQDIVEPAYQRIDWKVNESDENKHAERLLRNTILSLGMKFDAGDASEKALTQFDSFLDGKSIHPDIRRSVYVKAARERGVEVHSQLLERYHAETVFEERSRFANALAAIEEDSITQQSLALLQTENVRLQEVVGWLAFLFNNPSAKGQTWEWVKENWDWLQENFGASYYMGRIPKLAGRVFSSQQQVEDMKDFLASAKTDNIERSAKQAVEMASTNVAWKERDRKKLLNV